MGVPGLVFGLPALPPVWRPQPAIPTETGVAKP